MSKRFDKAAEFLSNEQIELLILEAERLAAEVRGKTSPDD